MLGQKTKFSAWRVSQALSSYAALNTVLSELTEEEVFKALETESMALRRPSIINRLIGRAVRLHEDKYADELRKKYMAHVPSKIMEAPKASKKPAPKPSPGKKPSKKPGY